MALVDVDRHILTEIKANLDEIDKRLSIINKHKMILEQKHAENKALFSHLIGEVKEFYTGKGTETPSIEDEERSKQT